MAPEGTGAVPTTTSGTDDDLREAFEAVEQERELEELEEAGGEPQEKAKTVEEDVSFIYLGVFVSAVLLLPCSNSVHS